MANIKQKKKILAVLPVFLSNFFTLEKGGRGMVYDNKYRDIKIKFLRSEKRIGIKIAGVGIRAAVPP